MRNVINKTAVFFGLSVYVLAVLAAGLILGRVWFGVQGALYSFVLLMAGIGIVIATLNRVRSVLTRVCDKVFPDPGYTLRQTLILAARGMSKIHSREYLSRLITQLLTRKLGAKSAAILALDDREKTFQLVASRGYPKNFQAGSLELQHPLLKILSEQENYLESRRLDFSGVKNLPEFALIKKNPGIITKCLEEWGAAVCVPSFLGEELRALLFLGPKKSGEAYRTADLKLLFDLAREGAQAFESARLHDATLRKSRELEQINLKLEYSRQMLFDSLKESEAANKQLKDTQAQLIHEQKMATLGRLAASVGHEVNNPLTILSMNVSRAILRYRKNPDLKVEALLDLFQKMDQNITRIKAVVNTLTGLLKRTEKGKFEPLSLRVILEETLPLVQFQTYTDNLCETDVGFEIPENIPLIHGDLERLQEVFLNLFINAYHAMSRKRSRRIRVRAEVNPQDPAWVTVYFSDNGCGMSKEIENKAFGYGFTTKAVGKGSGLGLYMCKYIVELHGGTIQAASVPGKGTTFILTLPVYQDQPAQTPEKSLTSKAEIFKKF